MFDHVIVPIDGSQLADSALAAAPTACVYGRIGTTTALFGTVTSWLVDVVNALTGNLDRPGGAMFTRAAAGAANTRGTPRRGRGVTIHRRHSRVRGLGETLGDRVAIAGPVEQDAQHAHPEHSTQPLARPLFRVHD